MTASPGPEHEPWCLVVEHRETLALEALERLARESPSATVVQRVGYLLVYTHDRPSAEVLSARLREAAGDRTGLACSLRTWSPEGWIVAPPAADPVAMLPPPPPPSAAPQLPPPPPVDPPARSRTWTVTATVRGGDRALSEFEERIRTAVDIEGGELALTRSGNQLRVETLSQHEAELAAARFRSLAATGLLSVRVRTARPGERPDPGLSGLERTAVAGVAAWSLVKGLLALAAVALAVVYFVWGGSNDARLSCYAHRLGAPGLKGAVACMVFH